MNALDLTIAILKELERQHPDARITQTQLNVIQRSANAIKDAMESSDAQAFILSIPGTDI